MIIITVSSNTIINELFL